MLYFAGNSYICRLNTANQAVESSNKRSNRSFPGPKLPKNQCRCGLWGGPYLEIQA